MQALEAALANYSSPERAQAAYERYACLGKYLRNSLRRLGIEPLAQEEWAAPVVATFAPPGDLSAEAFVRRCRDWGYEIGGQSSYLAERRLVQIAVMGAIDQARLDPFFKRLSTWLDRTTVYAQ